MPFACQHEHRRTICLIFPITELFMFATLLGFQMLITLMIMVISQTVRSAWLLQSHSSFPFPPRRVELCAESQRVNQVGTLPKWRESWSFIECCGTRVRTLTDWSQTELILNLCLATYRLSGFQQVTLSFSACFLIYKKRDNNSTR